MCWSGKINHSVTKLVADSDIPIFKVCRYSAISKMLVSYFQEFIYILGERYSQGELQTKKLTCGNLYMYSIDEGFHSYSSDCGVKFQVGLLAVIYPDHASFIYKSTKSVVVNGYIPKGAEYYDNGNGELVSTDIVLTEIAYE